MLVHAVTFLGSFSYPGFLCLKVLCFHMLGASVGQPPVPQCLTATQRLLKAHTSGGIYDKGVKGDTENRISHEPRQWSGTKYLGRN